MSRWVDSGPRFSEADPRRTQAASRGRAAPTTRVRPPRARGTRSAPELSRRRAAACLVGTLFIAACGGTGELEESGQEPARISQEQIERFQTLGYVGFSVEKADTSKQGAYVLDAERVQPGYSLYSSGQDCTADLIDLQGEVVRTWSHSPCAKWAHVELMPDGDLLVVGKGPGGRYLLRMSYDGEIVWKKRIQVHHDVELTPNGELLTLTLKTRPMPGYDSEVRLIDCEIARLSTEGELLETLSLDAVVSKDPSQDLIVVEPRAKTKRVDRFHCNSVEWVRRSDLAERSPWFRDELVLVSSRFQDRVYLIDWAARKVVWSWGRGQISGPHDATLLDNGNVLLFDNGLDRGWSRVVEVDPRRNEIVWRYGAPGEGSFYTEGRGSSQRLPNGNTLVAESNSGHAFEVTIDGDVVWEFWNPRFDDEGHRATLNRIRRFPVGRIEPLLD